MGENQIVFERTDAVASRFDTVIEWLLGGLLIFMPLAFGVVHAWSKEVVIALSGAILFCFLLKILYCRNEGIIWTWAYLPIMVFLLIVLLQLLPLPADLIRIISPNTAALKRELLGDLPNSDTLLKSMTLSFYPYATKHDLRLVLAVAAVFVVVVNVFRQPKQIKRLLMTIALIGGGVAVITLGQQVLGNGKIYWLIASKNTAGYSGPFVNHSNYGQFMNLSIGAALGWLCVTVTERFSGKQSKPSDILDYLGSRSARSLWLLAAIIGLGAATVFISLTRGGMVSMVIAAAFTTLLLISRKSLAGRGWIMVVMALVAFACILYVGFDAVYDRFATLRDLNAYKGRWQILKDLAASFVQFPVFGTGLGTHSLVYPMFDRSNIAALAAHAENEYAQTAGETGLAGLGSLIVFGIIIWLNYARNVKNTSLPILSATYGLGFGLAAILLASLSDFGQHLPANAFLSAIFCALLVGLAKQKKFKTTTPKAITTSRKSTVLRTAGLLCICGVWLWAFIGANNARIAEAHWKKALRIEKGLADKDWQGTESEYADLISYAEGACDYQPQNIKYRYWLNVYRWRSISRTTDPDTGELIIPEQSIGFVQRIVDELHKARTLCPTYGPAYSTAGQLEKFILNNDSGAKEIRKGFRLTPCSPTACFAAGFLDVEEDKIEQSFEKFKKAVQLDGKLFKNVADIYITRVNRPDLAIAIAGDNTGWLSYITDILADTDEHKELVDNARTKVMDLLEEKCTQPGTAASVFVSLGNIYRQQQNNEAAIEHYRRALAVDYSQVHWRLTLARLLADMGRISEAIHEARICLRLRPQLKAAKELIADLSVHPAALNKEIKSP